LMETDEAVGDRRARFVECREYRIATPALYEIDAAATAPATGSTRTRATRATGARCFMDAAHKHRQCSGD
jgi:hypothetical protein